MKWETDMTAVAGLNASLAGVLAGLAFAVLVLYLQNTPTEYGAVHGGVAQALCAAFVTLIMCAINYGTLTASPPASPQAILLLAMHVPVFGLSILLLVYCMALGSVGNPVMNGVVKLCSVLVVCLGPAVIMAYMVLSTYDIHTARCLTKCAEPGFMPVYTAVALCTGITIYGLGLLAWLRRRAQYREVTAERYGVVGWMVLWTAVLDFVVHGYLSLRGLAFWADNITQTISLCCMAAILAIFMTLCARVLPPLH